MRDADTLIVKPFSWPLRGLLAAVAIGGTVLYAVIFTWVTRSEALIAWAAAIGVSAGAAWVVFGALLAAHSGMESSGARLARLGRWADTCLITMAAGMVVLMLTVAVNADHAVRRGHVVEQQPCGLAIFVSLHAAILIIADAVMAIVFTLRARRWGVHPVRTVVMWVFVLNGLFFVVLTLVMKTGVLWR